MTGAAPGAGGSRPGASALHRLRVGTLLSLAVLVPSACAAGGTDPPAADLDARARSGLTVLAAASLSDVLGRLEERWLASR